MVVRSLIAALLVLVALPPAALAQGDPLRQRQWGLDMIEADPAHGVTRGAGATVAVIDSGVRANHPDLGGRLLPGRDFVENDDTPQDGDGHGTHVTGIVAANDGNGAGVSSVAPAAMVLPVRVLDDDGSGSVGDVAQGIDFAVNAGADVINLSLGQEVAVIGADPQFEAAIDRALDRGVIVVAASGNTGLPVCEQPSGRGRLLCVGAVDKRGMRSFFSSFGSGLGVVAPGGSGLPLTDENVLSTWGDGGYEEQAGTSQAAPFVSGIAALLVSRGLRGQSAVERIVATARDAGPSGPDPEYGAGIVNARAAVSGGSGSFGRVFVPGVQRLRAALRRGIRVRCAAAGNGRCRATASRKRRRLAAGSRSVRGGRTSTLYARANRRGRRAFRRALRRGRRLAVSVRVTLPGVAPQRRRVVLRP
ncbi:MAG TPA: S8 family serine peptidase [Thermoleophilaceae bacterium]|nr:S8 family serine peptidase [Thermoleophilaceae bacterium]